MLINRFGHLLIPINIKELQQTVKRLSDHFNANINLISPEHTDKVIFPVTHGFKVVNAEEIIRMKAEDCYTHVFTVSEKKMTISTTLKEFEDRLSVNNFFRVHKSHLINLNHLKDYSKLDGGIITMSDGVKIQVSRRKSAEFVEKFKEFNLKR